MISSTSNGRIRHLTELMARRKTRDEESLFVCEGFRMFEEAPDRLITEVYIEDKTYDEMEESFLKTPSNRLGRAFSKVRSLRDRGIPVEKVTDNVLKKISDTRTPQGMAFVAGMPRYGYDDLKDGNLLILENIRDPGNLGTMLRTAEGAGAGGVLMSTGTVDIFNPKTIRSTMGSLFRVPFIYEDDLLSAIGRLQKDGVRVYAASLEGSRLYDEVSYEGRCAFMIGNEGNGLSDEGCKAADERIRIPMEGQLESLNAAVSAAILLYNARR